MALAADAGVMGKAAGFRLLFGWKVDGFGMVEGAFGEFARTGGVGKKVVAGGR
jgi:hypothetical protein